jgi:hypothetical protein
MLNNLNYNTTKSINRFTVKIKHILVKIVLFISPIPAVLALILLLIFSSAIIDVLIFLCVMTTAILLFGIMLMLYKLEVDSDTLRFRSFFGMTKCLNTADIDKIVETEHGLTIFKNSGSKFATLSPSCLHYDNFIKYCHKNGLIIKSKIKHQITKFSLFLNAMRVIFKIGIFVGVFIIILTISLYFVNKSLSFTEHLLIAVGGSVFFTLLLLLASLPLPLKGIRYITKQEKYFGISFNEEMQKHNVREINYVSYEWFVSVRMSRIIVFRRGYLSAVLSSKQSGRNIVTSEINVLVNDGKKIKLVGHPKTIEELREWITS